MAKIKSISSLACRLNPALDQDIINDIAKYSDRTSRLKEVYRKVLEIESKGYTMQSPTTQVQDKKPMDKEHKVKTLDWTKSFPTEPTVRQHSNGSMDKKQAVTANLLKNNF